MLGEPPHLPGDPRFSSGPSGCWACSPCSRRGPPRLTGQCRTQTLRGRGRLRRAGAPAQPPALPTRPGVSEPLSQAREKSLCSSGGPGWEAQLTWALTWFLGLPAFPLLASDSEQCTCICRTSQHLARQPLPSLLPSCPLAPLWGDPTSVISHRPPSSTSESRLSELPAFPSSFPASSAVTPLDRGPAFPGPVTDLPRPHSRADPPPYHRAGTVSGSLKVGFSHHYF